MDRVRLLQKLLSHYVETAHRKQPNPKEGVHGTHLIDLGRMKN